MDSYKTENFLKIIKPMEGVDLMLAYKNSNDYNPEFVELLVEKNGHSPLR